ncbi:hypothetical protein GINT2_001237 [Glugoides intestinalis]
METKKNSIKNYLFSALNMMVITPIFIEAFGFLLLPTENNCFDSDAKSLFFLSTMIAQISFPLFSSISSGVIILPAFEVYSSMKTLVGGCLQTSSPLKNILLCVFVSRLIILALALFLYLSRCKSLFSKFPLIIIDASAITSSVFNIYLSFLKLSHPSSHLMTGILGFFSASITLAAMFILKKTHNPNIVTLLLIFLIASTNLLKFYFNPQYLFENKIFITNESSPLEIQPFINLLSQGNFEYKVLRNNIMQIITIAITPFLSSFTSFPFYSKALDFKVDYMKEMFAIGMANAFTLFPVSFNSSGSILFRLCGADSKIHSIIGGISIITLLYCHESIALILPTFSITFLLQFIGFSIFSSYLFIFNTLTKLDKASLIINVIITAYFKMNLLITICSGFIINTIISIYFLRGKYLEKSTVTSSKTDSAIHIKVTNTLDHTNIQKVFSFIDLCDSDIILDLSDVIYVDYTANIILSNIFKLCLEKKKTLTVIGNPTNINQTLLNNNKITTI